jgi:hypothetical protein
MDQTQDSTPFKSVRREKYPGQRLPAAPTGADVGAALRISSTLRQRCGRRGCRLCRGNARTQSALRTDCARRRTGFERLRPRGAPYPPSNAVSTSTCPITTTDRAHTRRLTTGRATADTVIGVRKTRAISEPNLSPSPGEIARPRVRSTRTSTSPREAPAAGHRRAARRRRSHLSRLRARGDSAPPGKPPARRAAPGSSRGHCRAGVASAW